MTSSGHWWPWAALVASVVFLAAGQFWLAPHYGWWNDEVYSLWASDPTGPAQRLTGDSNPPLYYFLLRLARIIASDPRVAMLLVNGGALLASCGFVLATARARARPERAALVCAWFIASGVTMFFFQESRAFFLGACLGLVAAWMATLHLEGTQPKRWALILAATGTAAAFTHFYAGLLTGCLGAALVAYGLAAGRRELVAPGLVLGIASTLAFALWFGVASQPLTRISWIRFTFAEVRDALWVVRSLTVGPAWMLLPIGAVFALGAMQKSLRPHLIVFAVASALFVVLPLLISLKTPIIVGRYWCVGLALLAIPIALVVDVLRANHRALQRAGVALAALCAMSAAGFGLATTHRFLIDEPVWSFADLVGVSARNCGPHSVSVPGFEHLYATASGLPVSTFVAPARSPPQRSPGCRIVAWAEDVPADVDAIPDMLAFVGLPATEENLQLERTRTGFVLFRETR